MTSTDERTKAVMRAYAEGLEPPPVAQVIARAERTPDFALSPTPGWLRYRRRLVLAAASVVVAAAAAVAVVNLVVNLTAGQPPQRGATTAAPTPTASSRVARAAPGCPPGLPLLDGPHDDVEGRMSKLVVARAGQPLTLPSQIRATEPDRPLLTFQIYLMPPGLQGTQDQPADAVAQSPVLKLEPDQQRVSPVVSIPPGVAPGTYNIVGSGTFPSPSVCGVKNPVILTDVGTLWGILGWVVIH